MLFSLVWSGCCKKYLCEDSCGVVAGHCSQVCFSGFTVTGNVLMSICDKEKYFLGLDRARENAVQCGSLPLIILCHQKRKVKVRHALHPGAACLVGFWSKSILVSSPGISWKQSPGHQLSEINIWWPTGDSSHIEYSTNTLSTVKKQTKEPLSTVGFLCPVLILLQYCHCDAILSSE